MAHLWILPFCKSLNFSEVMIFDIALKQGYLLRVLGSADVSNEKRDPRDPSCLGYTGDYTTQLYGDYN